MVLGQFSPLGGTLESLRQNRALLADQIRSRIAAAHADSRSNSSLKFEVDPYQLIGPINAHGVGSRQAGVEVQVPKKVGG